MNFSSNKVMSELRYIVDDKGTVLEVDYWTRRSLERCGPNDDEWVTNHHYIRRKDRNPLFPSGHHVYDGLAYKTIDEAIIAFKDKINGHVRRNQIKISELEAEIKQLQKLIK